MRREVRFDRAFDAACCINQGMRLVYVPFHDLDENEGERRDTIMYFADAFDRDRREAERYTRGRVEQRTRREGLEARIERFRAYSVEPVRLRSRFTSTSYDDDDRESRTRVITALRSLADRVGRDATRRLGRRDGARPRKPPLWPLCLCLSSCFSSAFPRLFRDNPPAIPLRRDSHRFSAPQSRWTNFFVTVFIYGTTRSKFNQFPPTEHSSLSFVKSPH